MKNLLLALLSLVIFPLASFAAPTTEAEQVIRDAFSKVQRTVVESKDTLSPEALDDKLRTVISPVFDFEEMSRGSLGSNWKNATEPQRKEFVELFQGLLARTYLQRIRTKIDGSNVEYLQPMTTNNRVMVRSKVSKDGETLGADYRMYEKNGRWRVYDVIIENVGLVTNYRNEFSVILKDSGFDGLLKKLREKTTAGSKS